MISYLSGKAHGRIWPSRQHIRLGVLQDQRIVRRKARFLRVSLFGCSDDRITVTSCEFFNAIGLVWVKNLEEALEIEMFTGLHIQRQENGKGESSTQLQVRQRKIE